MGGRTAFADVLDSKLSESFHDRPASPRPAGRHIPTVNVFFVEFGAGATPVRGFRGRYLYTANAEPIRHAPHEQPRPRRTLSSRERAALEQLNALGACIDADFSVEELRRVFRELARTYHPDRHPGSSASEKARLSMQFVRLHDAYRELQGAAPAAA
jgi:DnaJ domain